jgi:hypothetical protein
MTGRNTKSRRDEIPVEQISLPQRAQRTLRVTQSPKDFNMDYPPCKPKAQFEASEKYLHKGLRLIFNFQLD